MSSRNQHMHVTRKVHLHIQLNLPLTQSRYIVLCEAAFEENGVGFNFSGVS